VWRMAVRQVNEDFHGQKSEAKVMAALDQTAMPARRSWWGQSVSLVVVDAAATKGQAVEGERNRIAVCRRLLLTSHASRLRILPDVSFLARNTQTLRWDRDVVRQSQAAG
jgi:hypothetical protein